MVPGLKYLVLMAFRWEISFSSQISSSAGVMWMDMKTVKLDLVLFVLIIYIHIFWSSSWDVIKVE